MRLLRPDREEVIKLASLPVTIDKTRNFDRCIWPEFTPGDEGEHVVSGQYSAVCVYCEKLSGTNGNGVLYLEGSTDGGVTWFQLSANSTATVYRVVENPPELIRPRLSDSAVAGTTWRVSATGKFSYLSGRC